MHYKGIEWVNYHGALIPNVAPHIDITLTQQDIDYLLKTSNAYFLRWTSNWDMQKPTQFWHVIKDSFTPIESLSANTRSKIRRGLKRCQYKRVPLDTLIYEGYDVYKNAFSSYETHITIMSKTEYISTLQQLKEDENWECWEARNMNQQLIAYSLNFIQSSMCDYKTIKFDPKYLNLYVSEGLFYTMNEYYLNQRHLLYIDDGSRSLSHQTNIQEFLERKFMFRKAYCQLHIAYSFKVHIAVTVLYPFKNLINMIQTSLAKKIMVLLNHEEIRRSFES